MLRWMRTAHPEIDSSLTHTVVAVLCVLAFACAFAAAGIALYNDGDATVVSTPGAAAASGGTTIDFSATPGDAWKPFDPKLQPAPDGTEHAITLHAKETRREIAPGVTQEMWTFNDQIPSPILRGRVGDIFTITLVNDGVNGHSLDFHASEVAADDEMRTIGPGESLVYQFEATHAGIWMYHCGTAPRAAPHRKRHVRRGHHRPAGPRPRRSRIRVRPIGALPRRRHCGGVREDAARPMGRGRVQRVREPVLARADPGRAWPDRSRAWCWTPALRRTRRSMSSERSSTRCTAKGTTSSSPTRVAAGRRRSTCSLLKAVSSSSPSRSKVSIRS